MSRTSAARVLPPAVGALLVAVGGAAGSLARYGFTELVAGAGGVLACNLVGSALLGWWWPGFGDQPRWRLVAGVGFCGGLTTMSGFALDVAQGLHTGKPAESLGMGLVTVVGVVGSFVVTRMVSERRS